MPLNERSVASSAGSCAAVARHRFAGDGLQAPRPDVVAERIPGLGHFLFGRRRQRLERRVLLQPFVVFRQHAIDLRLLQHDLGHEDVVRVVGLAPWQVAPVAAIPGEQPLAEAPAIGAAAASEARGFFGVFEQASYNRADVKIYTRTGDAGETSLFDGTRVRKTTPASTPTARSTS